jgi:hypothetical protein
MKYLAMITIFHLASFSALGSQEAQPGINDSQKSLCVDYYRVDVRDCFFDFYEKDKDKYLPCIWKHNEALGRCCWNAATDKNTTGACVSKGHEYRKYDLEETLKRRQ